MPKLSKKEKTRSVIRDSYADFGLLGFLAVGSFTGLVYLLKG